MSGIHTAMTNTLDNPVEPFECTCWRRRRAWPHDRYS